MAYKFKNKPPDRPGLWEVAWGEDEYKREIVEIIPWPTGDAFAWCDGANQTINLIDPDIETSDLWRPVKR